VFTVRALDYNIGGIEIRWTAKIVNHSVLLDDVCPYTETHGLVPRLHVKASFAFA